MRAQIKSSTHGKGVETLLACRVPYLIAQNAVFEATLLCQERSADGRFFVRLELIRDLGGMKSVKKGEMCNMINSRNEELLMTFQQLPLLIDRLSVS